MTAIWAIKAKRKVSRIAYVYNGYKKPAKRDRGIRTTTVSVKSISFIRTVAGFSRSPRGIRVLIVSCDLYPPLFEVGNSHVLVIYR